MHQKHQQGAEIPDHPLLNQPARKATMKPSAILKVIGNDCRYQIIKELMTGEKNVGTINQVVKVSQPSLSQHLSALRWAGIIGYRRDKRQIFYYITDTRVLRIIAIAEELTA